MLSVIIPTHNRAQSVARAMLALDSQECTVPFEVVLALDGCTDHTAELAQSLPVRKPLRLIEAPASGSAAARNRGANAAQGDLLLFMDDDQVPQPGMLEAHIRAHGEGDRSAVVGPYPYSPEMPVNPLDFFIREWWRSRFEALADPTHRYTYRDCLTGNLSLSPDEFQAVGGFDEAFRKDGREDYEFGVRLLKSGISLRFAPNALAYHYPRNTPRTLLRKWYTFGRADVLFARKHPEVLETLPIRRYWLKIGVLQRCLRTLALSFPFKHAALVWLLGAFFDRHLDALWEERFLRLWYRSLHFTYLLGAVSALGGVRPLNAFTRGSQDRPDWPGSTVRIVDTEILSELREIGEADRCDRLLLVPRVRESVVGWIEVPCQPGQDSVPTAEIAERVSEQTGWPVWRSLVTSDHEDILANDADYAAWRSLRERIRSLSELGGDELSLVPGSHATDLSAISAVVFLDGKDDELPAIRPMLKPGQVVCVTASGGGLLGELEAVLSACPGDLVALLKGSDDIDSGWPQMVSKHFLDPQTACVVTPVILRGIRTRAEELYHTLVNFERVRNWRYCCLTDSFHPAYVLSQFNTACHRLVISRRVLESLCGSLAESPATCEGTALQLLYALLRAYERVIYEPRALIWGKFIPGAGAVKDMALRHTDRVYGTVLQALRSGAPGRVRALRILAKLASMNGGKLVRCARSREDWPLSFAIAQALVAARNLGRELAFRSAAR